MFLRMCLYLLPISPGQQTDNTIIAPAQAESIITVKPTRTNKSVYKNLAECYTAQSSNQMIRDISVTRITVYYLITSQLIPRQKAKTDRGTVPDIMTCNRVNDPMPLNQSRNRESLLLNRSCLGERRPIPV